MEILKVIKKEQVIPNQTTKSATSSQSQELSSNSSTNSSHICQLDKPEHYYYQAIGWLWATVAQTDEGFLQITLLDGGNSFDQETGLQSYNRQFSQAQSVSLALGVVDIDDFLISSALSVENITITNSPNPPQSTPESTNILGMIAILGFGFCVSAKSDRLK